MDNLRNKYMPPGSAKHKFVGSADPPSVQSKKPTVSPKNPDMKPKAVQPCQKPPNRPPNVPKIFNTKQNRYKRPVTTRLVLTERARNPSGQAHSRASSKPWL